MKARKPRELEAFLTIGLAFVLVFLCGLGLALFFLPPFGVELLWEHFMVFIGWISPRYDG